MDGFVFTRPLTGGDCELPLTGRANISLSCIFALLRGCVPTVAG